MKKIFVIVLGLAMCCAFVPGVYAIDEASLESRTTEGLYDRTDPFDLAWQPGLLYQLDRWRLYTVLSAYSGDWEDEERNLDSANYLIGTSGKLGPGSLAFMYETDKYEEETHHIGTSFTREDLSDGFVDGRPYYNGRIEGRTDIVGWGADDPNTKYKSEREENNFYAAYGMDFGGFSLGLSWAPQWTDGERTLFFDYDPLNLTSDYDDARAAFEQEWFWGAWGQGSNTSYEETETRREGYVVDWTLDQSTSSFSGDQDFDYSEHPIYLQSQIHTADFWHLLAGVYYVDINQDDDASGVFRATIHQENSETGRRYDARATVSIDGSLSGERDGDAWGIYLEPVYELNDMVSLRLDFLYETGDGDIKNGTVDGRSGMSGQLNATVVSRLDSSADTERWTGEETWDGSSEGDYDRDVWSIEPRVYLTFDSVRFALGAGYRSVDVDEDSTRWVNKEGTYTYDDGDGVATSSDWTLKGSWTEHVKYDEESDTETWRLPVAAEFDVTEKLTFRAGAAYYRQKEEKKTTTTYANRENENWTARETESGDKLAVGPQELFEDTPSSGDIGTAYQAEKTGSTRTIKEDDTDDGTTYHLGLGYQFTENLKFDLMFTGDDGPVDMTEAFASVTLAF